MSIYKRVVLKTIAPVDVAGDSQAITQPRFLTKCFELGVQLQSVC
jgi:hypothetical protein